MTDKVICNEEKFKELYKNNPEHADMLREMVQAQQEDVKRYAGPYIDYAKFIINNTPEEMKKQTMRLMAINAGTIAINILLNVPEFNREKFLEQLDEMIELRDGMNTNNK